MRRKLSEEHKRKIGDAMKGKRRTVEQRKRIGLGMKTTWTKKKIGQCIQEAIRSLENAKSKLENFQTSLGVR